MFTQFFGSYLLNQGLVKKEALINALEMQKNVKVKLGVLAIHAGFMTAEQVEQVHIAQTKVDKRIGDLAVEMGFMTAQQVEMLLSTQQAGYLVLGQALVDEGHLTNEQFESALHAYKTEMSFEDNDVDTYYTFDEEEKHYKVYISLLLRNLVRFIGNDFTPLKLEIITRKNFDWMATQTIEGELNFKAGIAGNEEVLIQLASRYSGETYVENDAYVQASIGEFLNLQDGLFSVNLSNERDIELDLWPQEIHKEYTVKGEKVYQIPVYFPFGTVYFIIGYYE